MDRWRLSNLTRALSERLRERPIDIYEYWKTRSLGVPKAPGPELFV